VGSVQKRGGDANPLFHSFGNLPTLLSIHRIILLYDDFLYLLSSLAWGNPLRCYHPEGLSRSERWVNLWISITVPTAPSGLLVGVDVAPLIRPRQRTP